MPEPKQQFSQHRRWLKTHFAFGQRKLDYSVTSKQENSREETIGFDALGAPSSYVTTVEPDRDLRWILFLMSGLALFAAFRANAHPLLLLGIYGGFTALVVLGLWLTRQWRSVGYTAIPAGTLHVWCSRTISMTRSLIVWRSAAWRHSVAVWRTAAALHFVPGCGGCAGWSTTAR